MLKELKLIESLYVSIVVKRATTLIFVPIKIVILVETDLKENVIFVENLVTKRRNVSRIPKIKANNRRGINKKKLEMVYVKRLMLL